MLPDTIVYFTSYNFISYISQSKTPRHLIPFIGSYISPDGVIPYPKFIMQNYYHWILTWCALDGSQQILENVYILY